VLSLLTNNEAAANEAAANGAAANEAGAFDAREVQGRLSWAAKKTYARAAKGAGQLMTRVGVLPPEPPDRDRRFKHWVTSLTRVHDSLAIAELGVPWWTYRAIDVVDAWLMNRPNPVRVFEYGSGASTLWLADRADEVISIEHHRGFADVIAPSLARHPAVSFKVVEPASTPNPVVGSRKPGHQGMDFFDYVHAIDQVPGVFDVIVIDGRAREACLAVAEDRLAHNGLIVFDNSHRNRYRRAIAASPFTERRLPGLTPTLPYPDQTSLLFPPKTT
jgi:hypothetical protein